MIRVVKDPDERKQELIDTAEKLFIKYGYDEVSVSDIVKKAGVAQGTFYYYFKSKDEMRNAVIDKNIEEVRQIADEVVGDKDKPALEKLGIFSTRFHQWGEEHGKIMDYIHEKRNEVLHYRMSRRVLAFMAPAYEKMIIQGNEEGVFKCEHPDLAAKAMLALSEAVLGEDHHGVDFSDAEGRRRSLTLLSYSEKILEAEPGLFVRFAKEKGVDI